MTKNATMVSWNDQWTTVFTGGWKRQNIQRHLYTTADGVAGDAAVSNQAIADVVNETMTSWPPVMTKIATLR